MGKASAEASYFHARIHELSDRIDGAVAAHEAKTVEVHNRLQTTTNHANETRNLVLERHQGLEDLRSTTQQHERPSQSQQAEERSSEPARRLTSNRTSTSFIRGELR